MLALSPEVGFIMEPFNLHHRPGICGAVFQQWFPYVCDENGHLYEKDLRACLDFRFRVADEAKAIRTPRDAARATRDFFSFTKHRLLGNRPLQKDPVAVFSVDWLARHFDMDVIVLIRHPAAFAGSLKAANWTFPFDHLLQQPLLMERHLRRFRADIDAQAKQPGDIISQSILLWNVIHHVIKKYSEGHDDWHFLRHEDLSQNPVDQYRRLYASLGLRFSSRLERQILRHSSANKPASLKRDSKANISTWKKRLTYDEIQRIKDGTLALAKDFYTEDSWQ
jgi:hypothetical protein